MVAIDSQPMLDRKPLLLLMDGHAVAHRAWHAIREPMNVADYKAHRPSTPPELWPQFDVIKEVMTAFGVPIYEQAGIEADDVLGTLCGQADEQGVDTVVLTGDTDTLQLVSSQVSVLLSHAVGSRTLYDVDAVRERYGGLGPESVADIKALEGDSSDNIPGVPGIGRKTAIKLLTEYGSIPGIYEHIDEVKPPRAKKNLVEYRETAFEAQFLTTIKRDADVTLDLDRCIFGDFARPDVLEVLTKLEFYSMISRIPGAGVCQRAGRGMVRARRPCGGRTASP